MTSLKVTRAGKELHWGWIMAALVIADITASLESMMIFAALPELIRVYGNPAQVGWLATGYFLVVAAAAAILGRLGDRYGRKKILLVALGCATVGSLISLSTTHLGIMIAGRCLQGAAGAILPLSIGIGRQCMPKQKLHLVTGILFAASSIGTMAGVVFAGMIVDMGAWHHIFTLSASFAAVSFVIAWAVVPSTPGRGGGRLDLIGGALFAPAAAAIMLGISNANDWGWTDSRFLGWTLGGVAVLVLWYFHERRHPEPLIDVRLLARRQIAISNLCLAIGSSGPLQLTPVLLLYLQQPEWTGIGLGLSATLAGLSKIPSNISGAISSTAAGHFSGIYGPRALIVWGAAFAAVGWLVLTLQLGLWPFILVMTFVCQVGFTVAYIGVSNTVVVATDERQTGEAMGVLAVTRGLFAGVGAQLVLTLLSTWKTVDPIGGSSYPSPFAFMITFVTVAALSALMMLLGLFLPKTAKESKAVEQVAGVVGASVHNR